MISESIPQHVYYDKDALIQSFNWTKPIADAVKSRKRARIDDKSTSDYIQYLQSDFAKKLQKEAGISEDVVANEIITASTSTDTSIVSETKHNDDDDGGKKCYEARVNIIKNELDVEAKCIQRRILALQLMMNSIKEIDEKATCTPQLLDNMSLKTDLLLTKILALCNAIPRYQKKIRDIRDREVSILMQSMFCTK